jgi:hypothetical protein
MHSGRSTAKCEMMEGECIFSAARLWISFTIATRLSNPPGDPYLIPTSHNKATVIIEEEDDPRMRWSTAEDATLSGRGN